MEFKKAKLLFLITSLLFLPIPVFAKTYSNKEESSPIIQIGAIVNDTTNANNFTVVIIGMIIVILILVGAAMFAPKK